MVPRINRLLPGSMDRLVLSKGRCFPPFAAETYNRKESIMDREINGSSATIPGPLCDLERLAHAMEARG